MKANTLDCRPRESQCERDPVTPERPAVSSHICASSCLLGAKFCTAGDKNSFESVIFIENIETKNTVHFVLSG